MEHKRKWIKGTNAAVIVLATLAIAVVANALASQFFVRFDLTENKLYTLSTASIDAVNNLNEPVQVRVFISPDMPAPFHNLSQQISDLLTEYAAASNGQLTFQVVNPDDDERTEEMAAGYGIQKVAMGQQTESEISLRAVYKGVAFVKGDKTEVIRDLQTTGRSETDNFEYEFTKALLNLQQVEPQRLAFITGFGGPATNPQFIESITPAFQQLYGSLIEITSVDLSAATRIPENVDAIVIINATQGFNDQAKFAIDQFIQRGGNVGWYQSSTAPNMQTMQQFRQQLGPNHYIPDIRTQVDPDLNSIFRHYGVQIRNDIVLDRQRALAFGMVMTPQGLARLSHAATFSITDIDPSLPFSRHFSTLALPGPSSVEIQAAARDKSDIEVIEVLRTAESAQRRRQPPQSFGYEQFAQPDVTEEPGPFVLAAALQGRFASYYQDNPLPEGIDESSLVDTPQNARIFAIGSGDFFQPVRQLGYEGQLVGLGGSFFISSLEWLLQDNSLSQIRSKSMPRLIGEVPRDQQRNIQIVNIAIVPALVASLGLAMMGRRRRRKESLTL